MKKIKEPKIETIWDNDRRYVRIAHLIEFFEDLKGKFSGKTIAENFERLLKEPGETIKKPMGKKDRKKVSA